MQRAGEEDAGAAARARRGSSVVGQNKDSLAELRERLRALDASHESLRSRMQRFLNVQDALKAEEAEALRAELFAETRTRLVVARERRKVEESLRWEAAL